MSWIKDPVAVLDWDIDWSQWLATGETLTTSTWTVPAGLIKGADSHTGTVTSVWLSGGVGGVQYRVTNQIETSAGRIDERSITIRVQDR